MDVRGATHAGQVEADLDAFVHASAQNATIDAPDVSEADRDDITAVMNALARLRDAERELAEASRESMALSVQDMKALRFLVTVSRDGEVVTPGMLAQHLQASPASTTKLLNRLERAGHITRALHPVDRRALRIDVTPSTEALVQRVVGRQQARRFYAAARLTTEQRDIVMKFLNDMTAAISVDRADWVGNATVRKQDEPEE